MKKYGKLIAVILSGAFALSLLSGCQIFGNRPDSSVPSEVAIADGYSGTASSWLASHDSPSTRERRLYEEAVENGDFEGTFLEFLEYLLSVGYTLSDDTASVNRALTSAVSVYAAFDTAFLMGSGVIYSLDTSVGSAYIVTNYHVLYSASKRKLSEEIYVYLYGGETFNTTTGMPGTGAMTATYVGGAMTSDIAVLKVESELLRESEGKPVYATAVTAANSDALTVSERVYAIGNACGDGISVVHGVVSVDYENIELYAADERTQITLPEIRTDAPINHGNSGGGLFNAQGELVGIVNARVEDDEETVAGFGYAIPVNYALGVVENILDNRGKFNLARLGAGCSVSATHGVFDEVTQKYYVEEKITIASVESGSAAAAYGLLNGDTLLSATLTSSNGAYEPVEVAITRAYKLSNLLLNVRFGDKLDLTYSRLDIVYHVTIEFDNLNYFRTNN